MTAVEPVTDPDVYLDEKWLREKTHDYLGNTNIVEWVWEHSKAEGEVRELLRCVAMDCADTGVTWPGVWHDGADMDLYDDLIALSELGEIALLFSDLRLLAEGTLALSQPNEKITVRFPAYEAWRAAR